MPLTIFIAFLFCVIIFGLVGCKATKAAPKPDQMSTLKNENKVMVAKITTLEAENQKLQNYNHELHNKNTKLGFELYMAQNPTPPEDFGTPKGTINCTVMTDGSDFKMGASIRMYQNQPISKEEQAEFVQKFSFIKDAYVPEVGGNMKIICTPEPYKS